MPNVLLRPLRTSDVETLSGWGEDPEFRAAAEWGSGGLEARRVFWQRMVDDPPGNLIRLAAVVDDGVVGTADLHGSEPTMRELGFLVGRQHWGRGIGSAVARAGLAYGFEKLDLECIWAEAWEANLPSVAILERLMRRTGPGDDGHYRGMPTRYVQFQLTRAEWVTSAGD